MYDVYSIAFKRRQWGIVYSKMTRIEKHCHPAFTFLVSLVFPLYYNLVKCLISCIVTEKHKKDAYKILNVCCCFLKLGKRQEKVSWKKILFLTYQKVD